MSTITGIGWTDETHNIAGGCDKISPGCKFCYAADLSQVSPKVHGTWGPNGTRVIHNSWPETMRRVNRKAAKQGRIIKVFINSMCDPCEGAHGPNGESRDGVRPEYLPLMDWILDAAEACAHLILQWLTKRPWNLVKWWQQSGRKVWPANLWVGVSVENNDQRHRIDHLRQIPAKVRFLSCEPLIGLVDLDPPVCPDCGGFGDNIGRADDGATPWCMECDTEAGLGWWLDPCADENQAGINWVIVGGESGHKARPVHPQWVRSLVWQCKDAGVPVFFKQWGEWGDATTSKNGRIICSEGWSCDLTDDAAAAAHDLLGHHNCQPKAVYAIGKEAAGNLLDGQIWERFPEVETPQVPTLFGVSNVR
jgi:protein gp37